jgi:uncharacterized membrane protein YedE/YeeE
MSHFTPVASLAGGVLIGLACAALWLLGGRLAGISSIAAGLLDPIAGVAIDRPAWSWRAWFLAGLLAGGAVVALLSPGAFAFALDRSPLALALAGLCVGVGTRVGGGCTSGHGVCGVGRLSPRSIAATALFMLAAGVTVHVVQHGLGGRL